MPGLRIDWQQLAPSEQINSRTREIDLQDTAGILKQINHEDRLVADAVAATIPQIACIVDRVVQAFSHDGRLFYVGAGTSGRLGVLDASECPPTFGVEAGLVRGLIAGGETALRHAVEGAEDDPQAGEQVIRNENVTEKDVVIGISASGGAAYVIAAIETARSLGAFTGALTGHADSVLARVADRAIVVETGPETLVGSTRMKAGTAQKLVLNMITTAAMIAWGKTYRNLMVDLQPTNKKLRERAIRMVTLLSGRTSQAAEAALVRTQWRVKPAVTTLALEVDIPTAQRLLDAHHGKLRAVLEHAGIME